MRFHKEIRFPGALDDVFAMLGAEDFRREVAEAASEGEHGISVSHSGGGFRARVDSENSTAGLPSAAGRVLGATYRIVQEEDWQSPASGTIRVSIPGKPGSVHGTVSLAEYGAHTVQTVEATIKVAVPFVGAKVEAAIGRVLGHVLKLQEKVGTDWLSR